MFGGTIETTYIYDIDGPNLDPPVAFESANNRLMKEIVEDIAAVIVQEQFSAGGGFDGLSDPTLDALSSGGTTSAFTIPETRTWVATKWYYYNDDGNVTRVVTDEGPAFEPGTSNLSNKYSAQRMIYAKNQRTVAYMVSESWFWKGPQFDIVAYTVDKAVGYRYDAARERYMERTYQPTPFATGQFIESVTRWTDYDNNQPYSDRSGQAFDLAMGQFDWSGGVPSYTTATYAHRDMIGTMRATSQGTTGTAGRTAVWTTRPRRPTRPRWVDGATALAMRARRPLGQPPLRSACPNGRGMRNRNGYRLS